MKRALDRALAWLRAPETIGRFVDLAIASLLFGLYLWLLLRTVGDLGYARDEGFYFQAARRYGEWFELLAKDGRAARAPDVVDRYWSTNAEHPALMKALFALSNVLLQKTRHTFELVGTSFRFPAMVFSSALIAVLYLWARRLHGRAAGLVAAISLGFFPRFFYHAHLACFDAPITAVFALTACAYADSLRHERGARSVIGPIVTGLLFGLALDTKHNAWFLPIAGTFHLFLTGALALWTKAPLWRSVRRILANLVAMGLIGPLVFYALWPWIWHDTLHRLEMYVQFHVQHEYYNMEFLHENYWKPPMPRGYAWLMTVATVPTISLVLFAIGFVGRTRDLLVTLRARAKDRLPGLRESLFIALCLGACYGPWLSRNTPIFGGTKHWMPAYPFLCLFAAGGFAIATRGIVRVARRAAGWAGRARLGLRARVGPISVRGVLVGLTLVASVVAAPIREALHAHPWGLSAYTPIVGGAAGAASLGLNRTFWGYTTGSVATWINDNVKPNGSVYIHDTAYQSWQMLQEEGRIRGDIRAAASIDRADVGLYHHELHMEGQEYQNWTSFGTVAPAEIGALDGVPVILVYRRPVVAR